MELVVGASNATMRSLLGKLGGLLAQEYALVRGVRRDVQYINDELTSMQAFLRDLSTALDDHDNRMKDWMKQIRDMGYDIEDCIDDFAHRIPRDPSSDVKCLFIRTRFYELRMWWPRRDIASKIADLKLRAQQIGERRRRYGVHNPRNRKKNGSQVGAGTYEVAEDQLTERQLIGTKEPVGMTADMEELADRLAKSDKSCEDRAVLSIVGFGGVGKTTIAMALYQKVRDKFDYRASVTVSQNYDEDAVLMMILKQVKPKESDHENQHNTGSSDLKQIKFEINHDKLVKELRDHLDGKRARVRQIRCLPVCCEAEEKQRKKKKKQQQHSERDETATLLLRHALLLLLRLVFLAALLNVGGLLLVGGSNAVLHKSMGAQRQRGPSHLTWTCMDYEQGAN